MCKICLSSPCLCRCPNAPEQKAYGLCDKCDTPLTAGYEAYRDDNDYMFCSCDCALEFYGVKAIDDTERSCV